MANFRKKENHRKKVSNFLNKLKGSLLYLLFHLHSRFQNTGGQLKKYMDNKIKNLSTNQTYMIVHGQLSGKGTRTRKRSNINGSTIKVCYTLQIWQKLDFNIFDHFANILHIIR
ncbi:hypothetical protein BpHYR1_027649 [Brachionus plicatilis]|uniref:Uncharacterized protein n=1 Tax=Brachionus plicatilis TaxID=10195 RepID=A0A3M7S3U2_BRAPC|nr:hypothetical protein BpHYR1_027649 [Brachionus plicatilis]